MPLSAGYPPEDDERKKKSPPVALTLRLRNLPATATEEALREALPCVIGLSLNLAGGAQDHRASQTATVCLGEISPDLERQLENNEGNIKTTIELSFAGSSHRIAVDNDFLGLTPLYRHEDWDLECVLL